MRSEPAAASRADALAQARTVLFVPANRPERYAKALDSGADAVVVDLEDSVPPDEKAAAREALRDAWPRLGAAGLPVVVRINPFDPADGASAADGDGTAGDADLALLASLASIAPPAGVMLPKAESPAALAALGRALPACALLPLIETAAGWDAVREIAAAPGVLRLVVGHIDFMADTGLRCSEDERELIPLRFAVAMATRLQRLAPAIDGVTTALDDPARLAADTRRALHHGFGGKLCIHPRQVEVVHSAMAPSAEEVAHARRVLAADAASGGAATQLDGKMVDLPVVQQARRTLARLR